MKAGGKWRCEDPLLIFSTDRVTFARAEDDAWLNIYPVALFECKTALKKTFSACHDRLIFEIARLILGLMQMLVAMVINAKNLHSNASFYCSRLRLSCLTFYPLI